MNLVSLSVDFLENVQEIHERLGPIFNLDGYSENFTPMDPKWGFDD